MILSERCLAAVTFRGLLSAGMVLGIAASGCDRGSAESPARQAPAPTLGEPVRVLPKVEPTPPPVDDGSDDKTTAEATSLEKLEKTLGVVEVKREGEPRLLHAVRAATNAGYDRVVFEFRDGVPGHHLEYIDKPVRDCGAGDVKPIEGDGWLEVRFYPANAHTEQGEPTVREREIRPGLPIVREIERTCDFEAVVTWVIGTASPHRYRAFELMSPARLVVDIDH